MPEPDVARLEEAMELLKRWVTPERDMTAEGPSWVGLHEYTETFIDTYDLNSNVE